jgi:phosphohistidine phosphatase SixA
MSRRALFRQVAALPLAGALAALVGQHHRALAAPAADVWEMLAAGGQAVLIRHAEAPGVGDPANFTLGDCSTQRNLSDGGRAQAERLGATFRERGVTVAQVLTSGWCRCIDTGTLAFGMAEVWPALNSFFRDTSTDAIQTAEVRARIATWAGPGTLVMVTHQVNITALTDIYPASGEIVALTPAPDRAAGFSIAGRVVIP